MLTLRPDLISAAERASVRAALDRAGWRPVFIADRQRLAECVRGVDAPLQDRLTALATGVTGATLRIAGCRWLRLRHGDYQLMKADALERLPDAHVEVIADLSAAATGEAELFYTDGASNLVVVPQLPGAVAIIERGAAIFRYQRYLTLRVGAAEVYRLRLTLARD